MSNKGFTLIETLFVLMIVCLLFLLSMRLHIPQKSDAIKLNEIISFLNEAKMEAMNIKKTVIIDFSYDGISYDNGEKQYHYDLAKGDYFIEHELSFNAMGHISKAKTVEFHTQQQVYKIVYQIGSGSFYVQ